MSAPRGPRPPHVVQVGFDDSVFSSGAASDTAARQVAYGAALDALAPGARLTLVSLTARPPAEARPFRDGNVAFVPVHVGRLRHLPARLLAALDSLHRADPLSVLTTQTVQEDGWVGLWFGRRHAVPVVGQVHYDVFSEFARSELFGRSAVGRARYRGSLLALPRFAALRVVGERLRERLRQRGYAAPVEVIPVPVTTPGLGAAEPAAFPPPTPAGAPVVLFVGRAVPQKNLEAWVRIAALVRARVPHARFALVGDGPELPRIRALADLLGLGDSTTFHGSVAYDALPAHYRSAAVLLLTSHYEGFGRVAVEAYRHGVPVVGTRVTGLEDIVVSGETGFLHEVDDHAGLARSVASILDDAALRARMADAGRDRTGRLFDPAELTRRWMQFLLHAARTTPA